MARTDKQEIAYALEILNDFQDSDGIAEAEFALTLLDNVDQEAYPVEMEEVRQALKNNKALNASHIKRQIAIPSLAKEGYWWYDPSKWHK